MTIEELMGERPMFQTGHRGQRIDWGVPRPVLKWIDANVRVGMRTLETGSGISTCAFVIAGAQHTAIDPTAGQLDEIKAWLNRHGVDLGAFTAFRGGSEFTLPKLCHQPAFRELDVVMIDGNHAFPSPMVDFFYVTRMLKVGGRLLLDDVNLGSPGVLLAFVEASCDWEVVERPITRMAVVVKTGAEAEKRWHFQQPWTMKDVPGGCHD